MKRIAVGILAFAVACGIFYTISLVLKPKPVAVMKPTTFKSMEDVGAVLYRRLLQDLQKAPIVILGSNLDVKEYDRLWSGFLTNAYNHKKYPKLVYQMEDLRPLAEIQGMEVVTLDWEGELLPNPKADEIHFIHTVYTESSRLFDEGYVSKTTFKAGAEPLVITLLPFAVNDKELADLRPACPLDEISESDMDQLGCNLKRVSRKYLRRKLSSEKLWAFLEQHGPREYTLYIHEANADYKGESF